MISHDFLCKTPVYPDLLIQIFANTGYNLLFSHHVIRILLHLHGVVFLSALIGL